MIFIVKIYTLMFGQILENLDKLWEWVKNISTLDYGALLKNFVAAVLIIVVCFLSTHLDMIASSPLFILTVVGIILLIFLIVQLISDTLKKMADKKEMASVSKRIICQEEIQHRLKDTLYKLNADRIFVEELHNSTTNFGDLGFVKFTMSYEVVNQTKTIPVPYISSSYQSQQATLYHMPIYLKRNCFFHGSNEEIGKIDNRYAFNMNKEGDKYGAYIIIPGKKDKPMIGWIGVSWRDLNDIPDGDKIRLELSDLTRDVASLFQVLN